jgi:hypothetical protein
VAILVFAGFFKIFSSEMSHQNKINLLLRGTFINASYQVSVHLGKQFQKRRFLEIDHSKKKNSLWRQCLLMDQN